MAQSCAVVDLEPLVAHPHVAVRDGHAWVEQTGVLVYRLWRWHRVGITCEELARRYPALGWARLLDALSFAYDNPHLMEEEQRKLNAILDRP